MSSHEAAAEAHRTAARAAANAGVRISVLDDVDDLARVSALLRDVWGSEEDLMSAHLLRAVAKTGPVVLAAHAGSSLVGATVGFFEAPDRRGLHSHVTGVAAEAAGRGVGQALKLQQRALCLSLGVTTIEWTFDPLIRRNAWLNLGRLGGLPTAYLGDFYGEMRDPVNAGDRSDRLLLAWRLDSPHVRRALSGGVIPHDVLRDARPVLDETEGLPRSLPFDDGPLLVRVPDDFEALRRADPATAARWRAVSRDVFQHLFASGRRLVGFDRDRGYVVGAA